MRIFLVTVDYKGNNAFLSIFICHEAINVTSPFFYFRHTPYMPVTSFALKVNFLIAEGQLTHTVG